jgi:ferric-dicitrate binding protein FerR (iron transport regulator)
MTPQIQAELQRLLSALCDGRLTEAEHERLEHLLESDPACRHVYLDYMDMHSGLLIHSELHPGLFDTSAAERPARPRRRGVRQALSYVLVAAATLAASLLVQAFWWPRTNSGAPASAAASRPATGHVATLTQSADCTWLGTPAPIRVGSRLAPRELHLRRGLALLRFDTGPELLLQGPAELHIDSGTSATLVSGKVVFRSDESAAAFELHTRTATVIDVGTEYGVTVGADGEDLQVFEGEVQRRPRTGSAEPEHIKAGEARHAPPARAFPSEPASFDPERFVRGLPAAGQPAGDRAADVVAYEGFDYRDREAIDKGTAEGGFGWASPWTRSQAWPQPADAPKVSALNIQESLLRPGAAVPPVGGRFECAGFAVYYRRLAAPIRLDTEGVTYLSCLFRSQGPPGHPHDAMALLLRPDEDPRRRPDLSNRLQIGVGGSNQVYTHLGRACTRTSLPLRSGITYLLVAKIVAGSSIPSQVFVRVYGPREPLGEDEPCSWTLVGPPFESRIVFEWLGIHVKSMNRQMIDEIRLGTTWASVTAPWIGPPGKP